ncbi:MAG: transcription-repair coupling factor [Clostridiaceae bacterium]|nr:transcription-repair coupling factor [Clostridiaceae bacterium]
MNWIIEPLLELEEYNKILKTLKGGEAGTSTAVTGLSDSQKAHVAFALASHLGLKGLFITHNEIQARRFYEDFLFFCGDDAVLFPTKEILYHDVEAKSNDAIFQRVAALERVLEGRYRFIVTSIEAISHKLPSTGFFAGNILTFSAGNRINLDYLLEKLVDMGYERVYMVEGKGQFSVRGGIIDVFPVDREEPTRIELFGDEIDSVRIFDPLTQRSVNNIESLKILPAREVICPAGKIKETVDNIRKDLDDYVKDGLKLKKRGDPDFKGFIEKLYENIKRDIERFESNPHFPGIDRYIPYIPVMGGHLLDYIGEDTLVFLDEPPRIVQRMKNLLHEHHETCKELLGKAKILPANIEIYHYYEDTERKLENRANVHMSTMAYEDAGYSLKPGIPRNYGILCKQLPSYRGFFDMLANDIAGWKKKGSRIVILAGTPAHGERLRNELQNNNIEAVYEEGRDLELVPGSVIITGGSLNRGFEYPSIGLAVISYSEFLGHARRVRKRRKRADGVKISMFTDLNPGDYVVHQVHGIGQYLGIEKLVVEKTTRDYIKIMYRQGDLLYVPTSQLDTVQKYIGSEGKTPRLSKLGGSDWVTTKRKVKESLKKLAEELIKLYARRETIKGFAFSKDTVWQKQFEDLFPYEETEDQLRCTEEIKRDMEQEKPMDRLLCGDVGYGKTEVALRAMFKAVMDGKQVAFLVPTTVLAQQHYNNFKERLKDFPVAIEMISRFRTRAEQNRILKDLRRGHVDVLIGTHRLLQKDIHFKDLGLLIIDEEQRFGVLHKERLKNIRPDVDVLTLTATPIPRTLHMSLVGARDISVIEEPPEDRYPVQTYVMEYDREIIKDAITRELARGGQVYYLFNRVKTIEFKAAQIQELVPGARIDIAHGQMEEKRLEEVMMSFLNGEFDVLVCTTIIESGLDMPNVNTIIVEDADRMGLAQLYQLRGRVGRSNRQAYAYITYNKDKILTEDAEKRLNTIREFTEFGSGFKIAMRDLEIRGAGNLLGPEQHGHMEAVGYDMYCRLLDEAIKELKGEKPVRKDVEVTVDLKINAYIDDSYISSQTGKIEMYKKIASIETREDVLDVREELLDRYGEFTTPVENLIQIAYIKALLRSLGFSSVYEKDGSIILQLRDKESINVEAFSRLAANAKYKGRILFNAGTTPYLQFKLPGINRENLIDNVKILLHDIKSFEVIRVLDV